jgi:hypothetical protein
MLNPFKLLAIYSDLNKLEVVAKEKAKMQVKVSQLLTLLVSLSATIGLPTLVTNWVHAHAVVYLVIVAAAIVLHALMPSIFAAPSAADTQATGLNKVGMILLMIGLGAMCAGQLQAQTATAPATPSATASTSNGFSGASSAVAIYYAGGWSAGTHVTESYDFVDFGKTKSNHLYVEGHELLAPTPGFSIYAGGLKYEPDLSALLKKTNLPVGNFGVTLSAALGNGVPSSGGSHVSFLAGGGVKYRLTQALTWQTLESEYGQYGSNRFGVISTGLSFLFGGKS